MGIEVRGVCALLQVFDMPTSLRFYRDVLGFTLVETSEPAAHGFDWVLMRLNDADVMLNTAYEHHERPAAPDATRNAAHSDTALYFGCPDVDAAYRYLRGKGVDVREPKTAPYGMKQLYLTDPDGYWLCFQWKAQ